MCATDSLRAIGGPACIIMHHLLAFGAKDATVDSRKIRQCVQALDQGRTSRSGLVLRAKRRSANSRLSGP
jgi:hypothetical protein